MGFGDMVIILIVAVCLILAARGMVSRCRNGCCGSVPKAQKKELSGRKVGEKIISIEGMHCENCKNRVERQINRIDGAVARVDLKKNVAVVSMSRMVSDEELTAAVERADFKVVGIRMA